MIKKKKKVSPHSEFGCIHEMMVSGCVGVSGLFVKHYDAVKLAFNQSSPPSRGAGLLQPSTDRRTAVQIQMHWAVPPQLAGHAARDPLKKWSQDCATWFFFSFFSLTCNINPNSEAENRWEFGGKFGWPKWWKAHIPLQKNKQTVDEKENSIAAFKDSPYFCCTLKIDAQQQN